MGQNEKYGYKKIKVKGITDGNNQNSTVETDSTDEEIRLDAKREEEKGKTETNLSIAHTMKERRLEDGPWGEREREKERDGWRIAIHF